MSFKVTFIDDGLGTLITAWDEMTEEDHIESVRQHLLRDTEILKKVRFNISDYVNSEGVAVSSEAVNKISEMCQRASKINNDIVIAIVAKADHIYGMSRMWEMLSEETGWETMVFRDLDIAKNWIRKRVKEKFGLEGLTFK